MLIIIMQQQLILNLVSLTESMFWSAMMHCSLVLFTWQFTSSGSDGAGAAGAGTEIDGQG